MTRNLSEVHLVGLVLGELPGAGQHRLDGAAGEGVLPLHDELVPVAADQLDVPASQASVSRQKDKGMTEV